MIIRSSKIQEGTSVSEEKGEFTVTHAMNIDPILKHNYESRKDLSDGWSKDRSYRKVASIDPITWKKWHRENPELLFGDKELREKTLYRLLYSEEGKRFWSVNKGV